MEGFRLSKIATCIMIESKKLMKSKLPLLTMLVLLLIPFVGGFFMFVLKDPDIAKNMGLVSAKAQLVGTADWPSFLSLLAQAISIGGLIVFGFVTSWVFGREYSDRTIKDLLALPIARSAIVLAKFIVTYTWSLVLSIYVFVIGFLVGILIDMPGFSYDSFMKGVLLYTLCAVLTVLLSSPVALLAGIGRGYLTSLGFLILAIVFAQIIAAVGYGHLFPWSIPALASGMTGENIISVSGIAIVITANVLGMSGTMLWWRNADNG